MNRTRVSATVLAVLAAFTLAVPAQGQQAKGKTEETKATTARSRGADENITTPRAMNNPSANVPAPANKMPGRERGASSATVATVILDNSTSWYIDIYIDGVFRGTMAPWGDSYAYALAGDTRLYARADFTDGSYKFWGPKVVYIGNGESYTWRLIP